LKRDRNYAPRSHANRWVTIKFANSIVQYGIPLTFMK
jgi:hypothetical protein